MNDYFERELKSLERELTYLKTSGQKSAGNVRLVTKTIHVSVPLVLNQYQTSAVGRKAYVIRKSSDALFAAYLDWYTDDIYKEWMTSYQPGSVRSAFIQEGVYNGADIIQVTAVGNRDDIDAMSGGASISISMNLIVKCSEDFTLEAL